MKTFSFLVSLFSSLTLFGAGVTPCQVPFKTFDGKAGSILSADVPVRNSFTLCDQAKKAQADTNVKLFHDGHYLYIGIEAMEPQIVNLHAMEAANPGFSIWKNDSIELNFDPEGRNQLLGKVVVDCNGTILNMYGEDDNTGLENFIYSNSWDSHVKVISVKRLSDRWTLELALPIGVFYLGKKRDALTCHFNIGRNRLTSPEYSDLFAVGKGGHNGPRFYPALILEEFKPVEYAWQVENLGLQCSKPDGVLQVLASAKVVNWTRVFHTFRATASLLDRKGNVLAQKSKMFAADQGTLTDVKLPMEPNELGRCKLLFELFSGRGDLLASMTMDQSLDWQPIRIQVKSPCYRNNIYATMQNFKAVKADILVAEGLGKHLNVTLTGPGYSKEQLIPATKSVNTVEFPFVDCKDGEYRLKAGTAETIIKKLPPSIGEFWIDEQGIPYVDGKKFLMFGGSSAPVTWKTRGVTAFFTFAFWKTPEQLKTYLDKATEAGQKVIFYPYIAPNYLSSKPNFVPFSNLDRAAGKVSPEQKEAILAALAITRNHPATLAYNLADEPEGWGHNESWYEDVLKIFQEADPYHPTVITNYGTGGQRRFYQGCDFLFCDSYPNYFSDDSTAQPRRANYDDARVATSLHSTAWMWIQSFDWGKPGMNGARGRAPTYNELREQTYLAFLGNIKGILLFTFSTYGNYSYELRIGREYLGPEMDSLKDLLLAPTEGCITVQNAPEKEAVFVGLKRCGKSLAVVAINTSGKPQTVSFEAKTALPASLFVAGEKRSISVKGGEVFQDTFRPHEVHIYVSDGVENDAVDLAKVRSDIIAAETARIKPGNLAAAGAMTTLDTYDYQKGINVKDIPYITCSSQLNVHMPGQATQYFLQDGICDTKPTDVMTWTPDPKDTAPWLEIDFGRELAVGRMVFYTNTKDGKSLLLDSRVLLPLQDGNYKEITSFSDNKDAKLEIKFAPVRTRKIRVAIDKYLNIDRLLHEWEIYEK